MGLCIKDLYLSADPDSSDRGVDHTNENTDVIVLVEACVDDHQKRMEKYVASFFSYENINELKSHHLKTGDFLNGKYFFSKNMLLIDDCSILVVRSSIRR